VYIQLSAEVCDPIFVGRMLLTPGGLLGLPIESPFGNGIATDGADDGRYPGLVEPHVGVVVNRSNASFLIDEDAFGLSIKFLRLAGSDSKTASYRRR
jgi:hypothetical protein